MLSLILILFKFIINNSVYTSNLSIINSFVDNLFNLSLNLSSLEKKSRLINTKRYCLIYDDTLQICLECEKNYTLLNGECVCYDRNCKVCSSSLYGACSECYEGFALSADNTCRCKINHCLLCDDHICDVCERGYILSEYHTSCELNLKYKKGEYCNDTNCYICMDDLEGSCLECKDGYNLINGSCYLNPTSGYYFQSKVLCPENYFSVGKVCNKICLGATCDIDEHPTNASCENTCLYCKQGILYEYLNCNMNEYCYDKNCTKCRNKEIGMCDRCNIGYKLRYGKCEQKCKDQNCLNCDYTLDRSCNWCKKGYILINGSCYIKNEAPSYEEMISIYENEIMNFTKNNNISYLGNGHFETYLNNQIMLINYTDLIKINYEKKYNELCVSKNCKSCLTSNPNYCMTCLINYTNRNGICVKCEIPNCDLCLIENECNRCKVNYALIKNQCIKDINGDKIPFCLYYKDNQCSQCENNYILENGRCTLNNIYLQNTSYVKLSCNNDNYRPQVCLKKFYYKNEGCLPCKDPKCKFCYDGIGCIICEESYNLIDGRCLKKTEFNETIENCISYDYDGKCIGCDSFCILKEEKCNCQIITQIIIYLTIGILVIIIAWIILSLLKQRVSMNRHEERIENDLKIIEENKLTQQELELLREKDKNLKKCNYCKNETALYRLSCGCLFCKEDFKELMERLNESEMKLDVEISNNIIIKKKTKNNVKNSNYISILNSPSNTKINKKKCSCCFKNFEAFKQIAQQCDICFETTSKIFHFKCRCAISVCKNCYNKIIEDGKCPGCRKNILFS